MTRRVEEDTVVYKNQLENIQVNERVETLLLTTSNAVDPGC